MKRRIGLITFLIAISLLFVGCNRDNIEEKQKETVTIDSERNQNKLILDGEIIKAFISKFNDSDVVSPVLKEIIFEDKETLTKFKNIISNASKEEGIANMANPELRLRLTYKDGSKQEINLWIGKKGQKSSLVEINDTNTVYTISEEAKNEFIDLIE